MPVFSSGGVSLYYEETGQGFPIVWSHEFGGNYQSWEGQVRHFSRRYRCVTYAARGYPPSGVPTDPEAYSQDIVVEDIRRLLDHLNIEQAHIAGLSMGGGVALNFGLRYPERCKSLAVASAGSGSADREAFLRESQQLVDSLLAGGMEPMLADYAQRPSRRRLRVKNPRAWQEFAGHLLEHSPQGSALTYRGIQMRRPTIFALEDKLRRLAVPTLVMVGDEDTACLEPGLFMKRVIPNCGLAIFPQTGHAMNLEEPERFNAVASDFFTTVEEGRWQPV